MHSDPCPYVRRLRDQNLGFLVWRTYFVLLRQSAHDLKYKKAWNHAMSILATELR